MSWDSVLTIILSGVLAAIVSIWTQKLQYRNEYYKLLINKRLEAYEILDKTLHSTISIVDAEGRTCYSFMLTYNKFNEFLVDFKNVLNYSRMYSNNTWNIISNLRKLVFEYNGRIHELYLKEESIVTEEYITVIGSHYHISIANEYYKRFENLIDKLQKSIYIDMLELHQIRKIKKKSKSINQHTI